ncbi:replication protein A1-like protein, partial [Trifolium medium]|nr:replication protein A1-like protein [Trifolium medium]
GVSNTFYGTKMLLNADVPYINDYKLKMEGTERELTQSVSQLTGPTILSLEAELLQTPRMTILDLNESSERCVGTVLVRTCDIETAFGWYYQSCTTCSSKVTIRNGSIYCDKVCKQPRTSVPRYKVNLQVIDNSGSTTFTLFDRVVTQMLGRSVQDLLAAMNQDLVYPTELDTLVDKRMLFKVEVNDANL